MKCKNCGFEFPQGKFCPKCGTPVYNSVDSVVKTEKPNSAPKKVEAERKKDQEYFASQKAEHSVKLEKQKTEKASIENNEIKHNQVNSEQEQKREDKKSKNYNNKLAMMSLVFGIISLSTLGYLIAPEIAGIELAFFSKSDGKMSLKAKIGLLCSILSIILFIYKVNNYSS